MPDIGLSAAVAPLGNFAITTDTFLSGGLRVVASEAERNLIPTLRRKIGMVAYQVSTNTWHQLIGDPSLWNLTGSLTNADWRPLDFGAPRSYVYRPYDTALSGSPGVYSDFQALYNEFSRSLAAAPFDTRYIMIDPMSTASIINIDIPTVPSGSAQTWDFFDCAEIIGIPRTTQISGSAVVNEQRVVIGGDPRFSGVKALRNLQFANSQGIGSLTFVGGTVGASGSRSNRLDLENCYFGSAASSAYIILLGSGSSYLNAKNCVFGPGVTPTIGVSGTNLTIIADDCTFDTKSLGTIGTTSLQNPLSVQYATQTTIKLRGSTTYLSQSNYRGTITLEYPTTARIGVQDDGSFVMINGMRPLVRDLNFIGAGVTATYNSLNDLYDITIPGATGSSGIAVRDEGSSVLTAATTLNFVGAGVTATNGGGSTAIITIPGGSSSIAVSVFGTPYTTNLTSLYFTGQGLSGTNIGGGQVAIDVPSSSVAFFNSSSVVGVGSVLDIFGAGVHPYWDTTITGARYGISGTIEIVQSGSFLGTVEQIEVAGGGVSASYDSNLRRVTLAFDSGAALETQYTGSAVGTHSRLNFSGSGVQVVDDPGNARTNVIIPGMAILDEGTFVTASTPALNFIGSALSASNDPINNRVNVTLNLPSSSSIVVFDEGVSVSTRPRINFIGDQVTAVDNPSQNRVDVTITTPTGSTIAVQDEGTLVGSRAIVNFIGTGVTAIDDSGNSRINVTIPGLEVIDEGTSLAANPSKLRFTGAGVTATYNGGADRIDVSIPGAQIAVQDEGAAVATVSTINFTGPGVTASYDSLNNRVNVDVQTGSGSAALSFYDEGVFVNSRGAINFTGASVTVTDDVPNSRIEVAINAAGASQLAGDTGAARAARHHGNLPSYIEPASPGWSSEINEQPGRSPKVFIHQGITFYVSNNVQSNVVTLSAFLPDGIYNHNLVNILTASTCDVTDLFVYSDKFNNGGSFVDRQFAVVTTVSGVYIANAFIGNYSNTADFIATHYGLSTFDLASGSGGRVTVVDNPVAKYVWVTNPSSNELAWFESPYFINYGVSDPGLGEPVVCLTQASIYGLIMATSSSLYKVPVNGSGLGTPVLLGSLSNISDVKFDGQRLVVTRNGQIILVDPSSGATIGARSNALIYSGSRVAITAQGYYVVSVNDISALVLDHNLNQVSRVSTEITTGSYFSGEFDGWTLQEVAVSEPGHLVLVGQSRYQPPDVQYGNSFSYQWGMGITDASGSFGYPHVWNGNGTFNDSDNTAFVNAPYGYDVRLRRIFFSNDVIGPSGDPALYLDLILTGAYDYSGPASASFLQDDTAGIHYYEQAVDIYVPGDQYWFVTLRHNPVTSSISGFVYDTRWAFGGQIVANLADGNNVTTLPYTINNTFTAGQPIVMGDAEVKLTVNNVFNGTDTIEVRVKKNGTTVATGSFVESAGDVTVNIPSFNVEAVLNDVFSVEIENATNPGSSADYTLVYERLFWTGNSAALGNFYFYNSNRSITNVEFKYTPITASASGTYDLEVYVNNALHHTYSFVEGPAGQTSVIDYAPPAPMTLSFLDLVAFKIVAHNAEPWTITWDGPGSPTYTFSAAVTSSLPLTTQNWVLTSNAPQLETERFTYVHRMRFGSPSQGAGQFLGIDNNGYVNVVAPPSTAPTTNTYSTDFLSGIPFSDRVYLNTIAAAAPFTLLLPYGYSLSPGVRMYFKDIQGNASVNSVTVDPDTGQTIEGSPTGFVINTDWGDRTVEWNGAEWIYVNN